MGSFLFPKKQRLSEGKPLERCTRAAAWRQQRHMAISEIAYKAKPNCIRCQLPLHQHKEPVHKRLSFLSVWSKFRTKEYLCSFPGKYSASCTNQYFPIANTNIHSTWWYGNECYLVPRVTLILVLVAVVGLSSAYSLGDVYEKLHRVERWACRQDLPCKILQS